MDTFPKQPADILDYDADYADFLLTTSPQDTIVSAVVTAEAGITVVSSIVVAAKLVKVWLSGGTSGVTYKITVLATTLAGRVKEHEFRVKVKEL